MKYLVLFVFLLFYKINFGQEVIRVNFSDSCIIRSGSLSTSDFRNMVKLCPAETKEVTSFIVTVIINSESKDYAINGNRWNKKIIKGITAGSKLHFLDIQGITAEGKKIKVPDITISIK